MKSLSSPEVVARIKFILESNLETDPIPGKIRAFLEKHDGKKLTKREAKKMQEEIDPSICIRTSGVGMFTSHYICWDGRQTGIILDSLTLDMKATRNVLRGGAYIDVNAFEDRNAAYFSARDERNAQRRKALADDTALQACAEAIIMMTEAQATLKALFGYGEPLHVESYAIEKAFGLGRD
jgi:hypothetical protein